MTCFYKVVQIKDISFLGEKWQPAEVECTAWHAQRLKGASRRPGTSFQINHWLMQMLDRTLVYRPALYLKYYYLKQIFTNYPDTCYWLLKLSLGTNLSKLCLHQPILVLWMNSSLAISRFPLKSVGEVWLSVLTAPVSFSKVYSHWLKKQSFSEE